MKRNRIIQKSLWMKVTADYMKEFGFGKNGKQWKELEHELDEMAQGDEMLKTNSEQQLKL